MSALTRRQNEGRDHGFHRGGRTGAGEYFRRLFRWRVGVRWYAIAFSGPVAALALAAFANVLLGASPPSAAQLAGWASIGTATLGSAACRHQRRRQVLHRPVHGSRPDALAHGRHLGGHRTRGVPPIRPHPVSIERPRDGEAAADEAGPNPMAYPTAPRTAADSKPWCTSSDGTPSRA